MEPMPTYQGAVESNYSGGAPARLQSDVQSLAPLATTFVTPQPTTFGVGTPVTPSNSGIIAGVGHFLGDVGKTIGHLTGSAVSYLARTTAGMGTSIYRTVTNDASILYNSVDMAWQGHQSNQLLAQEQNLSNLWRKGSITTEQFKTGLASITKAQNALTLDMKSTGNKINANAGIIQKNTLNAEAGLLTIITLGASGGGYATEIALGKGGLSVTPDLTAKTAGDWLMSKAATPLMKPVEDQIARIAVNPNALKVLTEGSQQAINRAAAEVVATGAKMTGAQIARATAVNLAIKYPLVYGYLSGVGTQVYKELQAKKYGQAMNTLALNAAIAVGGGILGPTALSGAGRATRAVVGSVFNKSVFIDELSKGLFNDSQALFRASVGNTERIKALSDLEATHMTAVGNDPVAAAWRVIDGEKSVDGVNAIDKGPGGWLDHNILWAKNAKLASETAQKYNLGPVSIGRWTANNARMVAGRLGQSTTVGGRLQVWEDIKKEFPNSAMSNHPNLNAQIIHTIKTVGDKGDIESAINSIKAGRFLEGFPEKEARAMAADGFVPISGSKHLASFVEGSGTLASKFANGEEFFTKAVSPLPVLGSVGNLLTRLGLSPYASTEQVNHLYNNNLAVNLRSTSVTKKVTEFLNSKGLVKEAEKPSGTFSVQELKDLQKQGYTAETIAKLEKETIKEGVIPQTTLLEDTKLPTKTEQDGADYARKIIASYANNPTRGGLLGAKFADERQLTTKDLVLAFQKKGIVVTNSEARELQSAIAHSHFQISTAVQGLGDRFVSFLYSAPGLRGVERRFLRLQGSLRFAFNPFFQYLRAVPKLEILSESQGGGFVKSIFLGRTQEMAQIREGLRAAGFLNKTGTLGVVTTDESVVAASGRNLYKDLLRPQENSVAGLVDSLARKQGIPWQEYITQKPDETRDIIQSIAEYSRKGDFINSPLARTLNVAFFPFRFETKVLQLLTKGLVQQNYLTKVAFIEGISRAHDYLNSAAGKAWYAQNSEAIGLFNYITPVSSLNEVFHSLLPGHDHSLGNFGELGGLPFGWIPQILDAEGLTHFNQPGVNPKTGQVYSQYIPKTQKGQIAIAIQDLLSSMFSYPGATAGLPSKGKLTRGAALDLVGGSTTKDFTSYTPTTPQGVAIQQLLHGPISATPSQTQTVPVRSTSLTTPTPRTTSVSKRTYNSQLKRNRVSTAFAGQPPLE